MAPSSSSFFAAVVLTGSLLLSTPALACKCMFPPVETARDDAAAVFEGRVLAVDPSPSANELNGERKITLRVVRTWKGLEREEQVEVYTNGSSAACGYTFATDTSYLVYARQTEGQPKLNVSSCSRTKTLADSSEDLAFLGAGSTPVAITKGAPAVETVDAGVPPVTPAAATPAAAVKKKGCAVAAVGETAPGAEGWLLAIPVLALIARRRRQRA